MKAYRAWTPMLALACLMPLAACNAENNSKRVLMKKQAVLDVVVFNYVNRPIFDVYLNRQLVGGSASLSDSPYGQNSTATGVFVPFGPQTLTWRLDGPKGTPRNGETVTTRAPLTFTPDDIPSGSRYLGVHIYPDESAELIAAEYFPEQSARGLDYAKEYQKNGK